MEKEKLEQANGARDQVSKRYDNINGVWMRVRKRYVMVSKEGSGR